MDSYPATPQVPFARLRAAIPEEFHRGDCLHAVGFTEPVCVESLARGAMGTAAAAAATSPSSRLKQQQSRRMAKLDFDLGGPDVGESRRRGGPGSKQPQVYSARTAQPPRRMKYTRSATGLPAAGASGRDLSLPGPGRADPLRRNASLESKLSMPAAEGQQRLVGEEATSAALLHGEEGMTDAEWMVGTALCFAFLYNGRLLPYREIAERQKRTAELFYRVTRRAPSPWGRAGVCTSVFVPCDASAARRIVRSRRCVGPLAALNGTNRLWSQF